MYFFYIVQSVTDISEEIAGNAAVEAARAGEHGKGFAVVAMEIQRFAATLPQVLRIWIFRRKISGKAQMCLSFKKYRRKKNLIK